MHQTISQQGVDTAIANLAFRSSNSLKKKLLDLIKQQYDQSLLAEEMPSRSIDVLIRTIWPGEIPPARLPSRRKNLNSLRSSINADLNNLYQNGKNPEGIIVNEDFTFDMCDDARNKMLAEFTAMARGNTGISLEQISNVLGVVKDILTKVNETESPETDDALRKIREMIKTLDGSMDGLPSQPSDFPNAPAQDEEASGHGGHSDDDGTPPVNDNMVMETDADTDVTDTIETIDEDDLREIDDTDDVPTIGEDDDILAVDDEDAIQEIDEDLLDALENQDVIEVDEDDPAAVVGDETDGLAAIDEDIETVDEDDLMEIDDDLEDVIAQADDDALETDTDGTDAIEVIDADDLREIDETDSMQTTGEEDDILEIDDADDIREVDEDLLDAMENQDILEVDEDELTAGDDDPAAVAGDETDGLAAIDEDIETVDEDDLMEIDDDLEDVIAQADDDALETDTDTDGTDAIEVIDADDLREIDETDGMQTTGEEDDILEIDDADDIREVDEDLLDAMENQDILEVDEDELTAGDDDPAAVAGDETDGLAAIDEDIETVDEDDLVEIDGDIDEATDPSAGATPETHADTDDADTIETIDEDELQEIDEDQWLQAMDAMAQSPGGTGAAPQEKSLSEAFEQLLGAMDKHYNQLIHVPAGTYPVGSSAPAQNDLPEQQVYLHEFYINKFPVTNRLFEIFVEKTGYKTTAEQLGFGFVYYGRFQTTVDKTTGRVTSKWQSSNKREKVKGACWHQPTGPASNLHDKRNHPVVQVSLEDAMAFTAWTGKRLPSEFEWEGAARTRQGHLLPWGDYWQKNMCNIETTAVADTTPVDQYPSSCNAYGIEDTLGNVLEWTADECKPHGIKCLDDSYHIVKGGSFLSPATIRLSTRFMLQSRFTANILGFRCVADP